MKILITGGTGFIGSHLVEKLLNKRHKIKVLVRKKPSYGVNFQNKEGRKALFKSNAEICYGDLLDKKSLEKAVSGIDIVYHLGAIARPMKISSEKYFLFNRDGTKNLLDACVGKKLKKIIIMSSISAVGPTRDGNDINEKSNCCPVDTYGWSKLGAEKIALKYFKKHKLPVVILRPPMVFGPRDFEMLRLFKAVNKRFFPINSNNECMEFLYVENLVDACLLVLKKGKNGETYHVSNPKHYSINEIINSIAKSCSVKMIGVKFPDWVFVLSGYITEILSKLAGIYPIFKRDTVKWMTSKFWYVNISKIKKLGYKGEINLFDGVKKTVNFYKENGYI